MCHYLVDKGAKHIILKRGEDGCILFTDNEFLSIPSLATEIKDGTGAGDCFDAGFIAALCHEEPIEKAAKAGSLAAAECLKNIGGAVNLPPYHKFISKDKSPGN